MTQKSNKILPVSIPLAAMCLLLVLVYSNSFNGAFVLDDSSNITRNPNVQPRHLTLHELKPSLYGMDPDHEKVNRPLSYLSFALNYYWGGPGPQGFHLVNFVIHLLSALVLFRTVVLLLTLPSMKNRYKDTAPYLAAASATLWALHPIQVTAVTYIVQRMASLCALFYLGGVYSYLKARTAPDTRQRNFWYAATFVAFLLALGTKENAVLFPFALLLTRLIFFPSQSRGKPLIIVGWLLLGFGLMLLCAAQAVDITRILTKGYDLRPFTLTQRLLTEPRALCFYLFQLAYPVSQQFTLLHDLPLSSRFFSPPQTGLAIFLLLFCAWLSLRFYRREPLLSFGVLFFLLHHTVESSVLPLEIIFEHRNYLPSMFLFVAFVILWHRLWKCFLPSSLLRICLAIVSLFVFATMCHTTWMRNQLFTDPVLLWSDNVRKAPGLHRPALNLGKALMVAGHYNRGRDFLVASLSLRAAARTNQKFLSHFNLGEVAFTAGHYETAIRHFSAVLSFLPEDPKIYQRLAHCHAKLGQLEMALSYLDLALGKDPHATALREERLQLLRIIDRRQS